MNRWRTYDGKGIDVSLIVEVDLLTLNVVAVGVIL